MPEVMGCGSFPVFDRGEYALRLERVRSVMEREGLDAVIATSEEDILYLTGVSFKTIERPFLLVVPLHDEPVLVLPLLELDHYRARSRGGIEAVAYAEYPCKGEGSWRAVLERVIRDYRRVGFTPTTRLEIAWAVRSGREVRVSRAFSFARAVKTGKELEAIRYSALLASEAINRVLEAYGHGAVQIVLYNDIRKMILTRILREVPGADLSVTDVLAAVWMDKRSSMPHMIPGVLDEYRGRGPHTVIVTVRVNGYYAEVERTFFTRPPTDKERKLFNTMLEARRKALELVAEGSLPSTIDEKARNILKAAGGTILHRTGHGIGLTLHEEPYLALGYEEPLRDRMVFSVEPGIYFPGKGGYRHSDTIAIKGGRPVILTRAPEELDELIVEGASISVRLKSWVAKRLLKPKAGADESA